MNDADLATELFLLQEEAKMVNQQQENPVERSCTLTS